MDRILVVPNVRSACRPFTGGQDTDDLPLRTDSPVTPEPARSITLRIAFVKQTEFRELYQIAPRLERTACVLSCGATHLA
jgi:hypothetical protein